jgi:dolichol kinase
MIVGELIRAAIYCAIFLLFLGVAEVVVRRFTISTDYSRRLAHIAASLFGILMWSQFSPPVFLICTSILVGIITLSYAKRLLRSVHNVRRKTYGEIFLPLGILVTYLIAYQRSGVFIPAILITCFADVTGGIISDLRNQGRPSKLGSVGFIIVAYIILVVCGQGYAAAASIAFVIMVTERISPYGSDNLTVPFVAAVLLLL